MRSSASRPERASMTPIRLVASSARPAWTAALAMPGAGAAHIGQLHAPRPLRPRRRPRGAGDGQPRKSLSISTGASEPSLSAGSSAAASLMVGRGTGRPGVRGATLLAARNDGLLRGLRRRSRSLSSAGRDRHRLLSRPARTPPCPAPHGAMLAHRPSSRSCRGSTAGGSAGTSAPLPRRRGRAAGDRRRRPRPAPALHGAARRRQAREDGPAMPEASAPARVETAWRPEPPAPGVVERFLHGAPRSGERGATARHRRPAKAIASVPAGRPASAAMRRAPPHDRGSRARAHSGGSGSARAAATASGAPGRASRPLGAAPRSRRGNRGRRAAPGQARPSRRRHGHRAREGAPPRCRDRAPAPSSGAGTAPARSRGLRAREPLRRVRHHARGCTRLPAGGIASLLLTILPSRARNGQSGCAGRSSRGSQALRLSSAEPAAIIASISSGE